MDSKRRKPPASILEIASAAGVSPATVSRAFNRPELLSAATRQHVLDIAEQHNFSPDRLGSSLRSGNTRTLGLVLPTLSNPVFADCFEGAEKRARQSGYSMMMTVTHYDPALEAAAVQRLAGHRLEGIILTVSDARNSVVLNTLKSSGMACVLAYNECPTMSCAAVDNRAAAHDMVVYLASLGHKRIAFLSGPLDLSDRARSRLKGARDTAKRLKLHSVTHHVMSTHTTANSAIVTALLRGADRPSALFCSNDLLAMDVISTLQELGVRVPDDISVAGFDGIRYGTCMSPTLTSIEAPGFEIGRAACHLLLEQIEHGSAASIQVPHRLVRGASAAAFLANADHHNEKITPC
ncbi:LacI family DNA-binding transcriptional regulator [Allopusillimonas ginsengisoli]|uniref:LacI family DNA-binding transcriptional regulator n=1 Tax=Allopusillimonas ginsengisoli TaxID=453575 RepID=UPI0010C21749|nr:LacI family DNA-binding transcriptional regulator [Allopusillimonas ginsengisoli]